MPFRCWLFYQSVSSLIGPISETYAGILIFFWNLTTKVFCNRKDVSGAPHVQTYFNEIVTLHVLSSDFLLPSNVDFTEEQMKTWYFSFSGICKKPAPVLHFNAETFICKHALADMVFLSSSFRIQSCWYFSTIYSVSSHNMWLHKYERHFSFLMQPTIHGRLAHIWFSVNNYFPLNRKQVYLLCSSVLLNGPHIHYVVKGAYTLERSMSSYATRLFLRDEIH